MEIKTKLDLGHSIYFMRKNKNKEIDKKYGIIKQKRRNLWQ